MVSAGYTKEEIIEAGYEGNYFEGLSWMGEKAAEHSEDGALMDELLLKALEMEEEGRSKAEIRKMLNDALNEGANYDAYITVYNKYRD